MAYGQSSPFHSARPFVLVGVGIALLLLVIALISSLQLVATPQANKVMVVRNGGPLDNRKVRQVVPPGAGLTWVGLFSQVHQYPSASVQRYYTITSLLNGGDRPGVDVVHVPSQDGVNLGVEGTFYLTTAFDNSPGGLQLARDFDDQFGTRTFPVFGGGSQLHAWDGDTGWSAFLDAIVRPVIDNELRSAMGDFTCAELLASCALVQNANATAQTVLAAGVHNKENIQKIEDQINSGLSRDLQQTLGRAYFVNIRFRLVRVTVPDQVQGAIDEVQAARVQIAKTQAEVAQARNKNQAASLLAKTYRNSPALAQIEMIKDLPAGSNVFFGVNPVVTTGATAAKTP